MAAQRFKGSSINWTALASRVPENQKPNLTAFKVKSDLYLRRMMANAEAPPKMNWEFYKSHVAVLGMVDDFQKKYAAISIPYPADTVSSQIDSQEKDAAKDIKEFINTSNARILAYQEEVKRLRALIPYDQMTMEDYKDAFPEQALDPINKPTFWPHTPEEQLGYKSNEPAIPSH